MVKKKNNKKKNENTWDWVRVWKIVLFSIQPHGHTQPSGKGGGGVEFF